MGGMLKVLSAMARRGALLCKKPAITLFAALAAFGAWADTEYANGYTWTYRINGDTAEIYGAAVASALPPSAVTIPSTLGGKRVVSIVNLVLGGDFTSVTIPAFVTNINYGIHGVVGFREFNVESANPVYRSVSGLLLTKDGMTLVDVPEGSTNVTIPTGVINVGSWAFSHVSGLASITVPSCVTNIGEGAFCYCRNLTSVVIGTGVKGIGRMAFSGCVELTNVAILDGVMAIGDEAFSGCVKLNNVNIPDSVVTVGRSIFTGCSRLERVTIPESFVSGNGVFSAFYGNHYSDSNASNLVVALSNGTKNIGRNAFKSLYNLSSITISQSVTNIDESAFMGCANLSEVLIPGSVKRIDNRSFYGSGLTNVILEAGVKCIGQEAFAYCTKLLSAELPDSVERVEAEAFSGCDALFDTHARELGMDLVDGWIVGTYYWWAARYDVWWPEEKVIRGVADGVFSNLKCRLACIGFPDTVAYIGNGAFSSLTNLNSVTLPAGMERVGDCAFSDCELLDSIYLEGNAPKSGVDVFARCNEDCCIYAYDHSSIWDLAVSGRWNGIPVKRMGGYTIRGHEWEGVDAWQVDCNCGEWCVLGGASRTGYAFQGWATNQTGEVVFRSSDRVRDLASPGEIADLFAVWACRKYDVVFDANGGEGGTCATLDYDTAITPPFVTRKGYTFVDWSPTPANTVPASNVTYTALWKINRYTVAFDSNGGEGEMMPQNETYDVGFSAASNRFAWTGHTFLGWATEATGGVEFADGAIISNLTAEADGYVTLYAVWSVNQYTLTFDTDGGSEVAPIMQDYGTAVTVPAAPTRTGYTFTGWTPELPATMPAEDLTVTAQWKTNGPVVTFNANGGEEGETMRQVEKGKAIGTLPKATRKGYKLKGWYTKKSGGTKIKATTKIKKNVTYYAQWTANKYKIKFNKNGGKGTMKTLSATYGKYVKLTANAFKRMGYKFSGWAKKKNGKVAYKNKAKVKNLTATNGKTVTLYAVWKKAKASSVKSAVEKSAALAAGGNPAISASSVSSSSSVPSVPSWAVGTFYGGDRDTLSTITVSKAGKVSGKVLFADGGRWTIVGSASGQRIAAVVTDASGVSTSIALDITRTGDGRCRIASSDGSISAEN